MEEYLRKYLKNNGFRVGSAEEFLEIDIWVPGRAFVVAEVDQIEYFYRFEEYEGFARIRSVCGGLRNKSQCRPLDYVCDLKYLKILVKD
jgi:hypothetical protein